MPARVSDSASNSNEQIAHAAQILGRSHLRRLVFEAIYYGKKPVKTVTEIAQKQDITRKQVLNEGRNLARSELVEQTRHNGETAYQKIDFLHHHKKRILSLAGNPARLKAFPTKRNPGVGVGVFSVRINADLAQTELVTVDDFEQFSAVRGIGAVGTNNCAVPEKQFKHGIQSVLDERGVFRDWGGEQNDLYTTQVTLGGRRRAAAFALKGPGTSGKLVPKKMGKNGDQIQRLFGSPATVFIVQYVGEIDESVIRQMEQLAIAKSVMTQQKIWYGVIDGQDSQRLCVAYLAEFGTANAKGDSDSA